MNKGYYLSYILMYGFEGVLFSVHVVCSEWCDKNQTSFYREGLIGERSVFPWLGVLRVHIHKRDKFSVAVTGIVLVKASYAIASAQDVSRVPEKHIIADSKAMFIISDYSQWYCGVQEVTLHPDFQYGTLSLALLHLTNSSSIPVICWPTSLNLSNQLYAIGYTDKNKILEKVQYKMNYVKPELCEEFYNRVGFKQRVDGQEFVCGAALTNNDDCEWDSGMVLTTNSTGYWTLIGFGVRGPGCAAPARFISTSRYLPWIERMIDLDEPTYNRYYGQS